MLDEIDHVAIAVKSLKTAEALYCGVLGFKPLRRETVADQGVHVLAVDLNGLCVELMEPTGPDSPVGRFLEKRGEGLHHLCFKVKDLAAELARLSAEGFTLIDKAPRRGAGGHLIAFVHPKSTNGVLMELRQA